MVDRGCDPGERRRRVDAVRVRVPRTDVVVQERVLREDDVRAFQPVTALAADPRQDIVMAGGSSGIYRSTDNGTSYQVCSNKVFIDRVTVSQTRLFCSGHHDVKVVSEDEAK